MSLIVADLTLETSNQPPDLSSASGEAARYLVSSLAALALDAGLLCVGAAFFGLPAWIAGAIAYGAGLVLIYILSIRWVFTKRIVDNSRNEFLVFATLGLIGLVINSATLSIATGVGFALPLAKILSAAISFATNFVSRKLLLFTARSS